MILKIHIFILLIFTNSLVFSQQDFFHWEGNILSVDNSPIPFSPVQIETHEKFLLFMSDEVGKLIVNYEEYGDADTLIIAYIGYKIKKISCKDLLLIENVKLEKDYYQLDEVVILADETNSIKLGNIFNKSKGTSIIGFGNTFALYIPNNHINGKVNSIRIYTKDAFAKGTKYLPFRLRLYDGANKVVGKELIKKEIIASLKPKEKHWVEIDLSYFDIDFPKGGVFVAVQALSADFYKENGYIKTQTTKVNKYDVPNSVSMGFTKKNKSNSNIQSWQYFKKTSEWSQIFCSDIYYMMQIIVEPYSRRY